MAQGSVVPATSTILPLQLDGLLVVDKPVGPTSHDIVARIRRLLRERHIGHTGTLDPMASGVLPLVVGRATRLARFINAGDKHYAAVVRLGFSTDTCDALGRATDAPWQGALPDAGVVNDALDAFRGTFLQRPPAYSAKKIGGERSYRLARNRSRASRTEASAPREAGATDETPATTALPAPVAVTATFIDLVGVDGDRVTLHVTCSSGFYVRALAHDLGQALGMGAHLIALRRTATCGVTLADAITLADIEADGGTELARAALIPLNRMLPSMPRVGLSDIGADRATKGRDLGPADTDEGFPHSLGPPGPFQLLDRAGRLVAIGERAAASGLLHPTVVLV